MRVCVVLEERFSKTPDGAIWTDGPFPHSFWLRYLEVFDEVKVVARVRLVESPPTDSKRADMEGVTFAPVPYYVGPNEYVRKARAVRKALIAAVDPGDAVIMHVPSNLGNVLFESLAKAGHPCALEVVGDPYDALSPGSVRHPLRSLFRWWFWRGQRSQCQRSFAVSYVTSDALQRRYPAGPGAFTTYYSNVELPTAALVPSARVIEQPNGHPQTLVSIGYMSHLYKSQDVLIDAVAHCVEKGLNLRLVFVGDGKFRSELETRAASRGVADRVDFRGNVSAGEAVRSILDESDVFVLPSRQEGLPRALVEAMARGLPCISSTVGGIPELLPKEDLVPPGDVDALATKIQEVVRDQTRMTGMSKRNLETAQDYREDILDERRQRFYTHVRERTAEWIAEQDGMHASGH